MIVEPIYKVPTTRRENNRMTKDFTTRLGGFAKLLGATEVKVFVSGNGGDEDDAWTMECEIEGMTFNVEVFGPYWDEDHVVRDTKVR